MDWVNIRNKASSAYHGVVNTIKTNKKARYAVIGGCVIAVLGLGYCGAKSCTNKADDEVVMQADAGSRDAGLEAALDSGYLDAGKAVKIGPDAEELRMLGREKGKRKAIVIEDIVFDSEKELEIKREENGFYYSGVARLGKTHRLYSGNPNTVIKEIRICEYNAPEDCVQRYEKDVNDTEQTIKFKKPGVYDLRLKLADNNGTKDVLLRIIVPYPKEEDDKKEELAGFKEEKKAPVKQKIVYPYKDEKKLQAPFITK